MQATKTLFGVELLDDEGHEFRPGDRVRLAMPVPRSARHRVMRGEFEIRRIFARGAGTCIDVVKIERGQRGPLFTFLAAGAPQGSALQPCVIRRVAKLGPKQ